MILHFNPAEAFEKIKWHPGHYVTLLDLDNPEYTRSVFEEISNYDVIRGIQKRYTWRKLEPTKDQYDFSEITRDLELAKKYNKFLIILLQTKTFRLNKIPVPDYILKHEYDHGIFETRTLDGTGYNLKLWNQHVKERLITLIRKLGSCFNNNRYLEAFCLSETAFGPPRDFIPPWNKFRYYNSLEQILKSSRISFPNTVVIQFVNYPRWALPNLIAAMKKNRIGLGGPDIFMNDPGLLGGVYPYYQKLSGQLPLAPSIQHENYYKTSHKGKRTSISVRDLYMFARDQLKANYIFWTRRMKDGAPYKHVLKLFMSEGFPKDPAGGLDSRCPALFENGCITE